MQDSDLALVAVNDEPVIHLASSKEMVELLAKHGVDTRQRDRLA